MPTAYRITRYQARLRSQLDALGLRGIVLEHPFREGRRWRFDIAVPELKIAIECDGGQFQRGRGRMYGETADLAHEKSNFAQAMGWKVFRFTNRQIESCYAAKWLLENVLGV